MKKIFRKMFLSTIMAVAAVSAFAAGPVSGRVTDSDGQPLAGVTVLIEGTTQGTITDVNGDYTIETSGETPVLSFNYIGTEPLSVAVEGRTTVNVALQSNVRIEDVVVIGYGQQKKGVVTAAISTVSNATLEQTSPIRLDDALKGLTSGVTVTSSSGQPGAGSNVRIRGYGTINNSEPLYIVDGMPVGGSGIDFLAPSDIERIDILKDAASAAVYGTRGANGVILVTTKNGAKAKGKTRVTYDFDYGVQNPWRKRDVLNATEYAIMQNEGSINAGTGIKYADPWSYGEGTNWQEELFYKNAPVQSHQLSISGGEGNNIFYLSAGWLREDGIIGGNFNRSNYERFTVRLNDTYTLFDKTDDRTWLNKMTFTTNTSYSRTITSGIDANQEYGSALGSAVSLSPILSVYATDAEAASYEGLYPGYKPVVDKNGRVYTIPGTAYNEYYNPVAFLDTPGTQNNYHRFLSNFEAEVGIWDNIKFRSSLGVDMAFDGHDSWTPIYYLAATRASLKSSVSETEGRSLTWQLENVLSYDKTFNDVHSVSVILGQSAMSTTGRSLSGSVDHMVEEDPNRANLGFTTGSRQLGEQGASGYLWADYHLASLFGRVSYSYDNRYMVQATLRRDGSSMFGPNNRFTVFPSMSVGWNIHNEAFMEDIASWLSNLKLRASWGKNGNDQIGAFGYAALTSSGIRYPFGSGALSNETVVNGSAGTEAPNPDLKWEETTQTDIGLDLGFFSGALNFSIDYYNKQTDGMLIRVPTPDYTGAGSPWGNVGKMKNSGWEFEANYRHSIGEFHFNVGANVTWLKNELIYLGTSSGEMVFDGFGSIGSVSRAANGMPYPHFYGYQTDGLFQNEAEIDAWSLDGERIQPNAVPGDVRFKDLNGDGQITAEDRTMIGKGTPDMTFGINAGFDWKGVDFSMIWQGVYGADVFDATYRQGANVVANMPRYMLERWTGEGTSNRIPRYTNKPSTNNNWQASDLYVKDGSYLRLKNLTLGYTLPSAWTSKAFINKLRVYVAATNVLTFTKYDGFDPEIASGGTQLGIDRGVYPQVRAIHFGANLTF
jgi:TonB-linked SusC/RagA family outer membrane protein